MNDPALEPPRIAMSMRARAQGESRVYQSAGDQHIYESPPLVLGPARRTLPRDTAAFTGRDDKLRQLARSAATAAASRQVVAIHAIDGMAGVGKTAFAIHAGHLLSDHFPDGQLFLRLHAHTPGRLPIDPATALAALLAELGVVPQALPTGIDARAALWRDRLAGKRVLLILDDAASHEQIEPLMPGVAGCLVLITSRRRLTALNNAVALPLDTLPPDEAAALVVRLAARSDSETEAVAQLVQQCGYLPLAISLLAGRLRHRPAWSVAHLVRQLTAAQDRLVEMQAENVAVAAAFDLSYLNLPADSQRLFRRLGLHPGADVDAYAAAALDDIPVSRARRHLDALFNDHLLDEPAYGRYRMHDLVHDYSRTLAQSHPSADNSLAIGRLLDYYQCTATTADRQIVEVTSEDTAPPIRVPVNEPDLSTRAQALAWMEVERANLLACVDLAANTAQNSRVVRLAGVMAGFLRRAGQWEEAVLLHHAASGAAQRSGDRQGQANALNNLGAVRYLTDDYPGAVEVLEQAKETYRRLGDRLGQARALSNLGVVRYLTSDLPGAVDAHTQALQICRGLGDRHGQANVLNELGVARRLIGDYPGAVEAPTQALELCRGLGDRLGQAKALNSLGVVRRLLGDYPGAVEAHAQALEICDSMGDRLGRAYTINALGVVRRLLGDYPGAVEAHTQALETYRALGYGLGQANVLHELGVVRRLLGDYPGAVEAHAQALETYRALGDRHGQSNALHELGMVRWLIGDDSGAGEALDQALEICRILGYRLGQAEVLNDIGTFLLGFSKPRQALARHHLALQIARDLHSPLQEARALDGAAQCALRLGQANAATTDLRQAVAIYQRIGAAEATEAAARLTDLEQRVS
jgi:tetratricopeptide (TPR) repeat protein